MHLFVCGDGRRTLLKICFLMDFNLQLEVERLRRMVNELPFEHLSFFPQLFRGDFYGFQHFFDNPLLDMFCMERSSRPRMNSTRHARNLARSLVALEQLLNNHVDQRRGGSPNDRQQSRINITLQTPVNQRTSQHSPRESSASNDTNSVCESSENGANDIEICAICREKFKERDSIRQLPCEHLFHPDCVRPWLQRRNTCPTCRQHL